MYYAIKDLRIDHNDSAEMCDMLRIYLQKYDKSLYEYHRITELTPLVEILRILRFKTETSENFTYIVESETGYTVESILVDLEYTLRRIFQKYSCSMFTITHMSKTIKGDLIGIASSGYEPDRNIFIDNNAPLGRSADNDEDINDSYDSEDEDNDYESDGEIETEEES
jgi:hypothetical protein